MPPPKRPVLSSRHTNSSRDDVVRLGGLIRRARTGTYSLEALAQKAQLSPGLLSQIERGQGNPSFVTLCKIADALQMPLGSFFEFRGPAAFEGMVVRRSRRKKLVLSHIGLVYELLTPDLKRSFTMIRTLIPAGFENRSRPFLHEGDECVLVISGRLNIFVGRESFRLHEGDSITLNSGIPHWWHNTTGSRAEILGTIAPPVF